MAQKIQQGAVTCNMTLAFVYWIMIDEYSSVAAQVHAETKIRGSRFLAFLTPVETPEAALRELDTLRKVYHDATHHCFAYRIGPAGQQERFSDAGEPSGTAGKPILLALQRAAVSDAVLIVIRYFGGTKLGVGGLRRAYAEAAEAALQRAERVRRILTEELRVAGPAELIGDVISAAARSGGKILRTDYGAEALVAIQIRRSKAEEVRRMLTDRTSGKARLCDP
jgi:uncharacterized YigZ family protein